METRIIQVYCLCDDTLKAQNHREDSQRLLCDAEILTGAIVAGLYFSGNYVQSMEFLADHKYIGRQMSRGRYSLRLNDGAHYLLTIFHYLGEYWKAENDEQIYLVEFFLTPGAFDDTSSLHSFHFDVPAGTLIVGDKAYNLYQVEDDLDALGIQLRPLRKKNLKRQEPGYFQYLQPLYRKMVETAGSLIQRLLPKSIHVTSALVFEIKVVLFILASSINALPLV